MPNEKDDQGGGDSVKQSSEPEDNEEWVKLDMKVRLESTLSMALIRLGSSEKTQNALLPSHPSS